MFALPNKITWPILLVKVDRPTAGSRRYFFSVVRLNAHTFLIINCPQLWCCNYNIRAKICIIRYWLPRNIDYTGALRDVAAPYRWIHTFRDSPLSLPSTPFPYDPTYELASISHWISMAKGLYRAPSNLPELLVVVLCKRPHLLR